MKTEQHLNLPSPVSQIITDWTKQHGVELWLKRDDLIHQIISGNKWRKLSGILNAYNEEDYSSIVTFGGAFSNHLIATACACSILGIPSVGYVRGEKPKQKNAVLLICEMYGMKLQYLSREEYKIKCRQNGIIDNNLLIPEGGACDEGTLGCELIINEVDLSSYSQLYVSCGTGTTIAGIARAVLKKQETIQLFGIQVLKGNGYIQKELDEQFKINNAVILDEYHFGGYAKSTNELDEFIKDFACQTGVLLDPIYTCKMMFAIKKRVENGEISRGSKVLAIHTGGLTGWFGKV